MSTTLDSIKLGLEATIDFSNRQIKESRVFSPASINVKALLKKIKMTQAEFAASFRISLGTLRHWERGDRTPHVPSLVLLNLVQKEPQTILHVLSQ